MVWNGTQEFTFQLSSGDIDSVGLGTILVQTLSYLIIYTFIQQICLPGIMLDTSVRAGSKRQGSSGVLKLILDVLKFFSLFLDRNTISMPRFQWPLKTFWSSTLVFYELFPFPCSSCLFKSHSPQIQFATRSPLCYLNCIPFSQTSPSLPLCYFCPKTFTSFYRTVVMYLFVCCYLSSFPPLQKI